ncbi:MAG TPA: hypothetical protein DDW86_00700 [Clostridiales bacterium]|jgi:hypothetical protein|nr:hypothetical protein [Clostridiales bacterium]
MQNTLDGVKKKSKVRKELEPVREPVPEERKPVPEEREPASEEKAGTGRESQHQKRNPVLEERAGTGREQLRNLYKGKEAFSNENRCNCRDFRQQREGIPFYQGAV